MAERPQQIPLLIISDKGFERDVKDLLRLKELLEKYGWTLAPTQITPSVVARRINR